MLTQSFDHDPLKKKMVDLSSNLFGEGFKELKGVKVERANYGSRADWKDTVTNNKRDNHLNKIDTFKER